IHTGRFAIALFDKFTGVGVRAFLDTNKLVNWPETRAWFLKLKSKTEQDSERLLAEIIDAGSTTVSLREITVAASFLSSKKLGPVHFCRGCGESVPVNEGTLCGGCRGLLPFT
ncbi:MAG: hypothetical protein JXR25_02300, partial [Pontiellaceae bacterium]|nr:hypothetical protein [Pontiellaceae bacterium]